MSFDDTDPHRRNMMLTSLAFIAFEVGGGRIPDCERVPETCSTSLQLTFLNVELTHLPALFAMAVTVLVWTGWRYWLKCNGAQEKLSHEVKRTLLGYLYDHPLQLEEANEHKLIITPFVCEKTSFFNIGRMLRSANFAKTVADGKHSLGYRQYEKKIDELARFLPDGQKSGRVSLNLSLKAAAHTRLKVLFKGHEFADWIVPWLLFWAATLIAVWNGIKLLITSYG